MFRFAQLTLGSAAMSVLWSLGLLPIDGGFVQLEEPSGTDAGPGISPDG